MDIELLRIGTKKILAEASNRDLNKTSGNNPNTMKPINENKKQGKGIQGSYYYAHNKPRTEQIVYDGLPQPISKKSS